MSSWNLVLSWVEHEKRFYNLGNRNCLNHKPTHEEETLEQTQSELPRPIPWNQTTDLHDNVVLTLHNVTLTLQKPCQHNNKCDCNKTNGYKWSLCFLLLFLWRYLIQKTYTSFILLLHTTEQIFITPVPANKMELFRTYCSTTRNVSYVHPGLGLNIFISNQFIQYNFQSYKTLGLERKQKLIKFFSFTIFWQSVEGIDFSFA